MFAGVASAAPPNWRMTVTTLPPTVSPGAPAGYQVTITNLGSGNIAALYLVAEVNGSVDVPTVYLTTTQGTCDPVGQPLDCSFGALNAGDSVTVVVAYTTPTSGSSFSVEFQGNTTGNTFADGIKGRSHGDTLLPDPVVTTTALNNGKNFAGFFSTDGVDGIGNSDSFIGNNKQSTRISGLPPGLAGTVQDGSITPDACIPSADVDCSLLDGETSVVTVGTGENITGGFFVIIHYKNESTPTAFIHTYGIGGQETIYACADPVVAPCFTWDDLTDTATIYTLHNGNYTKYG
jgi:hypothetical protein